MLFLSLELIDGKHYRESCWDTHVTFTLPCLYHQTFSYFGLTTTKSADNDVYTVGHEFGHAAHDLLGIAAPRTSFNRYIGDHFIRNTFFPLIDRAECDYKDSLSALLRIKMTNAIASEEYQNEAEYFEAKINDIKKVYTQLELHYDDEEAENSGIASLQRSIDSGAFNEEFLRNAIKIQMKYTTFEQWTNPEELFQISGISFCNGYVIVNSMSDLDLFVTRQMLFRWCHVGGDSESFRHDKNPLLFLNLSPSTEYVEGLLLLHGYDFDKYKQAANARLFSLDHCWILPYTSLTHALKKIYEMSRIIMKMDDNYRDDPIKFPAEQ
jgi:hypothetical protein